MRARAAARFFLVITAGFLAGVLTTVVVLLSGRSPASYEESGVQFIFLSESKAADAVVKGGLSGQICDGDLIVNFSSPDSQRVGQVVTGHLSWRATSVWTGEVESPTLSRELKRWALAYQDSHGLVNVLLAHDRMLSRK